MDSKSVLVLILMEGLKFWELPEAHASTQKLDCVLDAGWMHGQKVTLRALGLGSNCEIPCLMEKVATLLA